MLLYGPPGAGKKTIAKALLYQIYGASAEKVKVETKPWKVELPTRKLELELMTVSSNYHVEMNPSDVGNNDRCSLHPAQLLPLASCHLRGRSAAGFSPRTCGHAISSFATSTLIATGCQARARLLACTTRLAVT